MDLHSGKTKISSLPEVQIKSTISTQSLFENKDFLTQKYCVEKLPARQIAVLIGCAHSTINDALQRFGIVTEKRIGSHVPYGYKLKNCRRVPHVREQIIIRQVLGRRKKGWSNRKIADWLNRRGVPSPFLKKWNHGTVRRIVLRFSQGLQGLEGRLTRN